MLKTRQNHKLKKLISKFGMHFLVNFNRLTKKFQKAPVKIKQFRFRSALYSNYRTHEVFIINKRQTTILITLSPVMIEFITLK